MPRPVRTRTGVFAMGSALTLITGLSQSAIAQTTCHACYANCDGSTSAPVVNANDFQCFLNAYSAGDPYANCDGSTSPPIITANDFQCFLNAYSAGCPGSQPLLQLSGTLPANVFFEGDIKIAYDHPEAYLASDTTIIARNGSITVVGTLYGVPNPLTRDGADGVAGTLTSDPTSGSLGVAPYSLTLKTIGSPACSADIIISGTIDLRGGHGGSGGHGYNGQVWLSGCDWMTAQDGGTAREGRNGGNLVIECAGSAYVGGGLVDVSGGRGGFGGSPTGVNYMAGGGYAREGREGGDAGAVTVTYTGADSSAAFTVSGTGFPGRVVVSGGSGGAGGGAGIFVYPRDGGNGGNGGRGGSISIAYPNFNLGLGGISANGGDGSSGGGGSDAFSTCWAPGPGDPPCTYFGQHGGYGGFGGAGGAAGTITATATQISFGSLAYCGANGGSGGHGENAGRAVAVAGGCYTPCIASTPGRPGASGGAGGIGGLISLSTTTLSCNGLIEALGGAGESGGAGGWEGSCGSCSDAAGGGGGNGGGGGDGGVMVLTGVSLPFSLARAYGGNGGSGGPGSWGCGPGAGGTGGAFGAGGTITLNGGSPTTDSPGAFGSPGSTGGSSCCP